MASDLAIGLAPGLVRCRAGRPLADFGIFGSAGRRLIFGVSDWARRCLAAGMGCQAACSSLDVA